MYNGTITFKGTTIVDIPQSIKIVANKNIAKFMSEGGNNHLQEIGKFPRVVTITTELLNSTAKAYYDDTFNCYRTPSSGLLEIYNICQFQAFFDSLTLLCESNPARIRYILTFIER